MSKAVKKIIALLTHRERIKLFWLTAALFILAILDTVGVASIFPFLQVVSNPDIIQTNEKLKWFYVRLGFSGNTGFIIALGCLTFIILVASNIFRAFITTIYTRITWMNHYGISRRLLTQYLYEPYVFFLNRNSAELTNHLMAEVGRVIGYVLIPLIETSAKIVFVLLVIGLLLFTNAKVTLFILVIFGGGYGLVYLFFRLKLTQTGTRLRLYNNAMYKILSEAFGGIKEIKLLGKESAFIDRFSKPARNIIDSYCSQYLITTIPKYVFESLAFGGILLVTILSVVINKNYQKDLPMIGLYALAAYRLMPALQQIFQSVGSIRYGQSALNSVYDDIMNYKEYKVEIDSGIKLPFVNSIQFKDLTFQYPNAQRPLIENFNLTISANTTVGFVGGTGEGKTTVVDLLLGLLTPQKGEINIDGTRIGKENLRLWQRNIGYVPQHIYLMDDTISRNIAFGVFEGGIDQKAVEQAARLANIHEFIDKKLPYGYETKIGERGVRLSGGERQRIGIARALYHNPSLLVFDEATSALDGITESTILEAIYNLAHKKTIIIIAHRLTSVKQCDMIYLLEEGRIVANGSYDSLFGNNQRFQRMARSMQGECSIDGI